MKAKKTHPNLLIIIPHQLVLGPAAPLIQVKAQISARDIIRLSLPSGSFLVAGNYSGSDKNGEPWFSWEPGLSLSCAREGAETRYSALVTKILHKPRYAANHGAKRITGIVLGVFPIRPRQSARAHSAKG
jgi:hypothetical protein